MVLDRANYMQGTPFAVSQLLADGDYTMRKVTITGAAALLEGTALGAVLATGAQTVTPGAAVSGSGGTVGNGAVGTWTADAGAMAGTWKLVITNPASDAGKYEVVRPDGTIDGVGTVGVAYNGQLNGTLADGSADWVEDDYVPIVVSYDTTALKYKKATSAATDGSQLVEYILAQDADASAEDVEAMVYETGKFNEEALILGSGITVAAIRERLRGKGILIR